VLDKKVQLMLVYALLRGRPLAYITRDKYLFVWCATHQHGELRPGQPLMVLNCGIYLTSAVIL